MFQRGWLTLQNETYIYVVFRSLWLPCGHYIVGTFTPGCVPAQSGAFFMLFLHFGFSNTKTNFISF